MTYGGLSFAQEYYYIPTNGNANTRVDRLLNTVGSQSTVYEYSYDDRGNITHIYVGGVLKYSYTYDNLNQLVRENNAIANKTYTYTYDDAGNILTKKTYAYTTGTLGSVQSTYNYTYGNSQWGDQLTAYRGTTITYDALGNPKSYYNGASYSFSWTKGRQLSSVLYGSATTTFHYNADGIRTKKVGSSTVEYILNGSQIVAEKNGSHTIRYLYDPQGAPVGMNLDGTVYLYEKNLQGDIVGIYTTGGTKVVSYDYDAWGKLISSSYTSGYYDPYYYNPFRYRGYYYDTETGFYYLQSRYYDPTTGRFLNADIHINANGDLQGYNMYAYCSNNPVSYADYTGEDAVFVIDTDFDIKTFDGTGIPIAGHARLYIQGRDGTWCLVEYTGSSKKEAKVRVEENYNHTDLNALLEQVNAAYGYFSTYCNGDRKYIYLYGDYSKSVSYASLFRNTDYCGYFLFSNNCLHFAQTVLSKGNPRGTNVKNLLKNTYRTIPYLTYLDLLYAEYQDARVWMKSNINAIQCALKGKNMLIMLN